MKLYLVGSTAVMTAGANPRRIRFYADGKASTKESGSLTVGQVTVPVENGTADLPLLRGGYAPVSYHSNSGRRYDGGVKIRQDGSVQNSEPAMDIALLAATKTDKLSAEISQLKDAVAEINAKVEYKGLDFMLN